MFARTISKLTLALALSMSVGVVACGNQEPKTVTLKPGDLPPGAEWRGVYYSQVYGNLHLVDDGDQVVGKWRTAAGDAWGELYGKAEGNVLTYDWSEHRIGMIGPSAKTTGKGYFRYTRPENGDPDEIIGEWGLHEENSGNPWKGIKQKNVIPDPDSVMPDEVEGRFTGGSSDWDEGTEGAKPPKSDGDEKESDEGEDEDTEETSSGWD